MVYHVMPYMVGLMGRGQVMLPHSTGQDKNSTRQTFLYRRNRTYSRQCYCLTSALNVTYHMWTYVKYYLVY